MSKGNQGREGSNRDRSLQSSGGQARKTQSNNIIKLHTSSTKSQTDRASTNKIVEYSRSLKW